MKPISDSDFLPPVNRTGDPIVVTDKAPAPGDIPLKMLVPDAKPHPMRPAEASQAASAHLPLPGLILLPSSEPLLSLRGQATGPLASSSIPKMQHKVEAVELANHVSLQIFSTEKSKNNKNVVLFLHGGPGLAYDDAFENVTSWSLEHGYTLVAPEIAGSGKPGLLNTSDSFANPPNYVSDLGSVIQYLREHEDFKGKECCAVAHSWGGFQLASLLTDQSSTSEDKNFFKQVVFVSPNLDSAQTRIFAMIEENGGFSYDYELQDEMARRHAGSNSNSKNTINIIDNPLMDQNLNEKISPFYRLDKMPRNIPYLFVHPTKDKNVPASQSLAAVEEINRSNGNARIVMTTNGNHVFFKTGKDHDPIAMNACFDAIDNLIKDPDSLKKVTVDDEFFDYSDSANIDKKIKDKDQTYENQKNLLNEWHEKKARLQKKTRCETKFRF